VPHQHHANPPHAHPRGLQPHALAEPPTGQENVAPPHNNTGDVGGGCKAAVATSVHTPVHRVVRAAMSPLAVRSSASGMLRLDSSLEAASPVRARPGVVADGTQHAAESRAPYEDTVCAAARALPPHRREAYDATRTVSVAAQVDSLQRLAAVSVQAHAHAYTPAAVALPRVDVSTSMAAVDVSAHADAGADAPSSPPHVYGRAPVDTLPRCAALEAESKAEAKAEAKAESKAESKAEAKAESKAESKAAETTEDAAALRERCAELERQLERQLAVERELIAKQQTSQQEAMATAVSVSAQALPKPSPGTPQQVNDNARVDTVDKHEPVTVRTQAELAAPAHARRHGWESSSETYTHPAHNDRCIHHRGRAYDRRGAQQQRACETIAIMGEHDEELVRLRRSVESGTLRVHMPWRPRPSGATPVPAPALVSRSSSTSPSDFPPPPTTAAAATPRHTLGGGGGERRREQGRAERERAEIELSDRGSGTSSERGLSQYGRTARPTSPAAAVHRYDAALASAASSVAVAASLTASTSAAAAAVSSRCAQPLAAAARTPTSRGVSSPAAAAVVPMRTESCSSASFSVYSSLRSHAPQNMDQPLGCVPSPRSTSPPARPAPFNPTHDVCRGRRLSPKPQPWSRLVVPLLLLSSAAT
jgi:hypothetical protein